MATTHDGRLVETPLALSAYGRRGLGFGSKSEMQAPIKVGLLVCCIFHVVGVVYDCEERAAGYDGDEYVGNPI